MVDFHDMPFHDNAVCFFDALDESSISSSAWTNKTGGTNFVLNNAVTEDSALLVEWARKAICYAMIPEPQTYTFYVVLKNTYTTDDITWMCNFKASSNQRIVIGSLHPCKLAYILSNNNWLTTNLDMVQYHVYTISRSASTVKIYFDGVLLKESSNTNSLRADKLQLNTNANPGVTPTQANRDTVPAKIYIKNISMFSGVQSDEQVLYNAQWLLWNYGLAPVPADSDSLGIDAVAQAWCMKDNLSQWESVNLQKTNYRMGIKAGSTLAGDADDIIEPWESGPGLPDEPVIFPTDIPNDKIPPPNREDPSINDSKYVYPDDTELDMNKGVWGTYVNPNNPDDYVYVHLVSDNTVNADYYESGRHIFNKGDIYITVYKNGQYYARQYALFSGSGNRIPRIDWMYNYRDNTWTVYNIVTKYALANGRFGVYIVRGASNAGESWWWTSIPGVDGYRLQSASNIPPIENLT